MTLKITTVFHFELNHQNLVIQVKILFIKYFINNDEIILNTSLGYYLDTRDNY